MEMIYDDVIMLRMLILLKFWNEKCWVSVGVVVAESYVYKYDCDFVM